MWDVNEQAFHMGVHTLILYKEDIYFLTGLSHRGSREARVGENPQITMLCTIVCRVQKNIVARLPLEMFRIYHCGPSFIPLPGW
jgi:hypothetical protein